LLSELADASQEVIKIEDKARELRKDLILKTEEAESAVAAADTATVHTHPYEASSRLMRKK
jgi:hypothetical protein